VELRVWEALLSSFLRRLIRRGALRVHFASGRVECFGDSGMPPAAVVRIHDRRVVRRLVLRPSVALGEGYMNGGLTLDGDDLLRFLEVLHVNLARRRRGRGGHWRSWLRRPGRRLSAYNPPTRARRNASHHYDLSDALFESFLDPDRQYSCAYFADPGLSLEAAQEAKKRLIATKLLLKPGHRVIDIGCGWGGLALHLARSHGARVTGVTLSEQQWRRACDRAADCDRTTRPTFLLEDYRRVTGRFDRVVSVGMLEHVGMPHYGEFFEAVRSRLHEDGVALIHTIGRTDGPAATDPWVARYIFPGGTIPALSEILPAIERAGLVLTDLEVWRLHYASTLRAWREKFQVNRQAIRAAYDERFCRMWTYYLTASEAAFRHGGLVVFQLQLATRQDAVPLTRDYLARPAASEREMAHSA